MKKIPFECKIGRQTYYCLANEWKKDNYRYSLELSKILDPEKTILVIGLNPGGKTDPEKLHFGNTIRRVLRNVIEKYDSVLFVNLTPVIALTSKSLNEEVNKDKMNSYHGKNLLAISTLIRQRCNRISNVLLCYGNSFKYGKELFSDVLQLINNELPDAKCWCFGLSDKGYPYHPLARKQEMALEECRLEVLSLGL